MEEDLGVVIGSRSYKDDYMNEKLDHQIKEEKRLSKIGKIESQCALVCFISGYEHKLNYYMRTVPNISHLLRHTDDVITKQFTPAIRGVKCSEVQAHQYFLKRLTLNTRIQKW